MEDEPLEVYIDGRPIEKASHRQLLAEIRRLKPYEAASSSDARARAREAELQDARERNRLLAERLAILSDRIDHSGLISGDTFLGHPSLQKLLAHWDDLRDGELRLHFADPALQGQLSTRSLLAHREMLRLRPAVGIHKARLINILTRIRTAPKFRRVLLQPNDVGMALEEICQTLEAREVLGPTARHLFGRSGEQGVLGDRYGGRTFYK